MDLQLLKKQVKQRRSNLQTSLSFVLAPVPYELLEICGPSSETPLQEYAIGIEHFENKIQKEKHWPYFEVSAIEASSVTLQCNY